MGVAHVGLVHRDPCECKVKGFRAVSSIERNVSKRRHLQGVRQHTTPSARTIAPQLYRRPTGTKLNQPSLHQKHCDLVDSSQEIYGIGRIGGPLIRQRDRDEVVSKLAP